MSNLTQQPTRLVAVTNAGEHPQRRQQQPRLRLTRRGRVVIALFVSIVTISGLALFVFFGAAQAQASAEQGTQQFTYVAAEPGDSMWNIATRIAPTADPRDVIADIVRLNQLPSVELDVGQELAIPVKYAETHG